MATWQQLVIPTDSLITALIDRGILPPGTTRINVWGGNQLGVSYIKITIANDGFDDVPPPAPVSDVDVPAAIEALGA
jgi:hypothetical protein